jgi:TolA-binding protein
MSSGFQSSIITRSYKSGSIIYFENDKSEYIYILKSGRVILTYTKIDTGEEIKEEVRQGEFFGVKSALGKYPREETAQTIGNGDTVVLVLTMADFERMILRNVNVVKKMLRVFSNQLRKLNKTVRTVLGEGDNIHPDIELFRIGEHYYKAGDYNKATYVFKKYMEYYPDTDYSKLAMNRIKDISFGGSSSDKRQKTSADNAVGNILSDFTIDNDSDSDFHFDDHLSSSKDESPNFSFDEGFDNKTGSNLSDEMNDFFSDTGPVDDFSDFDDFDFDHKPGKKAGSPIETKFNEGLDSYENADYKNALSLFSEVINKAPLKDPHENELLIDSYFYSGICSFNLKNYKAAMSNFGEIIKNFSNSNRIKETLMYAGEIFEKSGQKEKAIGYYNRVINTSPKNSLNSKASDKIKALQKK